jgi:hypothetical protein
MSGWVLVKAGLCDCVRSVPGSGVGMSGRECDCQPPIPRSVWDAMVERGARGFLTTSDGNPDEIMHDGEPAWRWYVPNGDVFLRAALGNPTIEGDTP